MANDPSFSEDAVNNAIASASQHYSGFRQKSSASISSDDGHLATLAECIELVINDGKVCLVLPLGIGKICIPIPVSYDGKVAQACLSICTIWGIPTGVKVTVSVAGVTIISKVFGKC
ncbi:hypothetical protein [Aliikangiella coralliicola]|uniref:Uncharacterized protein n=1 Tax=Aliikangiella coralliicola TaxID=2592383 RepID=A0A545UFV2_9GAMM|nr:hypothetical protein [Aliikangiella coralliicola]TQV88349.1 hypothetical protein FLL46_07430 [Aliikangiella coralliicola]